MIDTGAFHVTRRIVNAIVEIRLPDTKATRHFMRNPTIKLTNARTVRVISRPELPVRAGLTGALLIFQWLGIVLTQAAEPALAPLSNPLMPPLPRIGDN